MKADIVMKTNQDPFEYAECLKNLVDSFPTVDNMIELANAYLKIQVNIKIILIFYYILLMIGDCPHVLSHAHNSL